MMAITVKNDGLLRALSLFPDVISKHLRVATANSAEQIALEAKRNHRFISRTGTAENSISSENIAGTTSARAYIPVNVSHAIYQHEGTGIYGQKGTPIKPKSGKFLKFLGKNGTYVYARSVKGIKKDQYLYKAAIKLKTKTIENINAAIAGAIKAVGL
jgi:hypothetical protein